MYNEFISSNDDDLFAEPKDNQSASASKTSNDFAKDLEDLLKDTLAVSDISFKSKFVNAFNDSASAYIFNLSSLDRSIYDELNKLTQGAFSYRYYADTLEEGIAKRIIVHDFLSTLLNAKNEKVLKFLAEKMKVTLDTQFFTTYVISMQEIMSHVIDYSIQIYCFVCQKINRTPLEGLINRNADAIDPVLFNSNHYFDKHFSAIRSEMGLDF